MENQKIKRVTLTMEESVHTFIKVSASKDKISMTEWFLQAIEDKINKDLN